MTEISSYIINKAKGGQSYLVQDEYNMGVIAVIPVEEVRNVDTIYPDEEVAAILGVIELVRKSCTTKKHQVRRIDEEAKISTVTMLLRHYSPEEVIRVLDDMKYHEISELCLSEEPLELLKMV